MGYIWKTRKRIALCTPLFRRPCQLMVGVCFLLLILLSLSFMGCGWISANQIWWQPYLSSKEVISRCWLYFVGVSGTAALLLISPKRTIPVVTQWGRNSLIIYVVHRPLVQLSSRVARPEHWGSIEMLCPLFLCMAVLIICVLPGFANGVNRFFDLMVNIIIQRKYVRVFYGCCFLLLALSFADLLERAVLRLVNLF